MEFVMEDDVSYDYLIRKPWVFEALLRAQSKNFDKNCSALF